MPELPELEVITRVLRSRILGQRITSISMLKASGIIVRNLTPGDFAHTVEQATIQDIEREGKYLVAALFSARLKPLFIVINLKLSGRLQLAVSGERRLGSTHVVVALEGGRELRYIDTKKMGQIYLTQNLARVPDYTKMGPDALEIRAESFVQRLKLFKGEIKGILTRGECVSGIGNAYADEILWDARIHPYLKRAQLTEADLERLYASMRGTLEQGVHQVAREVQEAIHTEPRGFMRVHRKGGQPCPRCGTTISVIQANQRITNFCRTCQPGGLIHGM